MISITRIVYMYANVVCFKVFVVGISHSCLGPEDSRHPILPRRVGGDWLRNAQELGHDGDRHGQKRTHTENTHTYARARTERQRDGCRDRDIERERGRREEEREGEMYYVCICAGVQGLITVTDMDTIEKSNLSRQVYRHTHTHSHTHTQRN